MARQTAEKPCIRGCTWPESTDDDPRPRPARHGFLCARCYYGLERGIAELPAQHSELAGMLQPSGGGSNGYVTGSPSHPLPIDPRVAEHRALITGRLTSWAQMVAEERGEVGALSPHPTVTATYLGSRLDWCAEQPWIDDMVAEIADTRGKAFALLYPRGRRHLKVGPCPMEGCHGTLTATIADEDDRMSTVDCDEEPSHMWDSLRWLRLGHRIEKARTDAAAEKPDTGQNGSEEGAA